jgi:hypothetical protein
LGRCRGHLLGLLPGIGEGWGLIEVVRCVISIDSRRASPRREYRWGADRQVETGQDLRSHLGVFDRSEQAQTGTALQTPKRVAVNLRFTSAWPA